LLELDANPNVLAIENIQIEQEGGGSPMLLFL
jgi:hypothetical protein